MKILKKMSPQKSVMTNQKIHNRKGKRENLRKSAPNSRNRMILPPIKVVKPINPHPPTRRIRRLFAAPVFQTRNPLGVGIARGICRVAIWIYYGIAAEEFPPLLPVGASTVRRGAIPAKVPPRLAPWARRLAAAGSTVFTRNGVTIAEPRRKGRADSIRRMVANDAAGPKSTNIGAINVR